MKRAGLRMDVDTVTDAREGLEGLRRILLNHNVRCTVFVHMGKSISHGTLFRNLGRTLHNVSGRTQSSVAKIGVGKKLGRKALFQTLLMNPDIGPLAADTLGSMAKDGHELALHGGRNHTVWQRKGTTMSGEWTLSEVSWGKAQFEKHFGTSPLGFSTPGFAVPETLEDTLAELGFAYHSDTWGSEHMKPRGNKIRDIPVNVVGPDTVPIIEHLSAAGLDASTIAVRVVERFREVAGAGGVPVIYGHPSTEGHLLSGIFSTALEKLISNGWSLVGLKELLDEA
jgi:hypothetical protein